MTLVPFVDGLRTGSLALLAMLLQASLEAAVVAGMVLVLCRSVPGLPAGVKVWLWWLVSAKLLVGLLPVAAVPLPLMPARTFLGTELHATTDEVRQPLLSAPTPAQVTPLAPARAVVETPVSIPYRTFWPLLLVLAWIGVAAVHGVELARALGRARYLRRHTEPVEACVVIRLAQLVRTFRLAVHPRILGSRFTTVPLLTGIVRPAILLPAASPARLSRTELDLVLGHELAHVRRGDLVWGWVPAIAARLFFFDPLARLAAREYLAAREEACDAEVLQRLDVAPADYGHLLLKLGVATTDDVLAAAGSSPTFAMLKRRLIMLDRSRIPASRWWWTLAAATAVLVPLTLVAQPAVPAPPSTEALPVVPVRASVLAPPPPVRPAEPLPRGVPLVKATNRQDLPPPPPPPLLAPPAPPAPPTAPVPPVPAVPAATPAPPAPAAPAVAPYPPAPRSQPPRARHNDSPWVLLEPGGNNLMSGSSDDRSAAQRQRQSSDETLLWFRHKGTDYVSHDPATIQAIRDAFARVQALGDEMGRVGGRMGARGDAQGAIGAQQAELGAQQARLAADMSAVAAEHAARVAADVAAMQRARAQAAHAERRATTDAGRPHLQQQEREDARVERDHLRAEQRAQRQKVAATMRALADQQRALGDQMRALGRRMETHGAEMKQLGDTLEEAMAAARSKVAGVFDRAVAAGSATPAK